MNIMKQISKIFMNKNIAVILYALIAAGIVFMLFPGSGDRVSVDKADKDGEVTEFYSAEDMEQRLESILSMTEGTGKVKVMITYKNKGNIIVAENKTDEANTDNGSEKTSHRRDVVFNNENMPVVLSEGVPEIEGVVIVAQGGGNIEVKNSLIEAAEALLGVEPHKIEVLKMKTEGQ